MCSLYSSIVFILDCILINHKHDYIFFKKPSNYKHIISDHMHSLPKEMIPTDLIRFKEIIPVSALTGEGTEQLIMCLRKVLDEEAEKSIEQYQKEQLRTLRFSEI